MSDAVTPCVNIQHPPGIRAPALIPGFFIAKPAGLRIAQLRQRLQALGAKPCHEDRLLRGWSQVGSYDRKNSPADNFFPLAMREAMPVIEAELAGLARLISEHPANGHGMNSANNHEIHDRSPTPTLPRNAGAGANVALHASSENEGVARLLVGLHDGQTVESVLLPRGGLCVSTQVGCAVGCVFCMSGRNGLIRQLGSAEIVAQVVLARHRRAVTKVVFMGMGEPAHNLDNVLEAIALLGTEGNIGHKNLVLSTVGDLRVFERLMDGITPQGKIPPVQLSPASEGKSKRAIQSSTPVKPALALSLHSTNASLRARLLPHAPPIPIEELVERAEIYARATGYPVQYQWTLIEDVNDGEDELAGIARLLHGKYAVMNFIPFNAVDGLSYRRPSQEHTAKMAHTLKQQGILVKIRDSAGQEIEGACGQLRARAEK